jgi:hypothetical protein
MRHVKFNLRMLAIATMSLLGVIIAGGEPNGALPFGATILLQLVCCAACWSCAYLMWSRWRMRRTLDLLVALENKNH